MEISSLVFLFVALGAPAALTIAFYFRLSGTETAIVAGAVAVVLVGSGRIGMLTLRHDLADMKRWLRGAPVAAEVVLPKTLLAVSKIIRRTVATQTVGHCVVTVAVMDRYVNFSTAGLLGTELALAGVLLAGTIIVLQAWQVLMRPAAEELAAEFPPGVALPRAGLSVAARITIGVLATGMTAGAALRPTTAPFPDRRRATPGRRQPRTRKDVDPALTYWSVSR